jgi:hypothetical protein
MHLSCKSNIYSFRFFIFNKKEMLFLIYFYFYLLIKSGYQAIVQKKSQNIKKAFYF